MGTRIVRLSPSGVGPGVAVAVAVAVEVGLGSGVRVSVAVGDGVTVGGSTGGVAVGAGEGLAVGVASSCVRAAVAAISLCAGVEGNAHPLITLPKNIRMITVARRLAINAPPCR